ncbi:hypothetical protein [Desulfobacula sp.]|uniref:hypothetical protein n=1 Tax=Desulfobacula sp. TaxID=2593537 RepID=UPI0025BAD658|nr:hypothetical protein [Desulfobacula sp.]MBC2704315.1 hypothetical protein [Desulfobacula sp.]MCK4766978.1 hypothetical protein [Desulfobacula sp.]
MDKKNFGFYYGIILAAVGLGVFYRIPQVMLQVETIEFFRQKLFLLRLCFYVLGGLLILAGGIRIYKNYK